MDNPGIFQVRQTCITIIILCLAITSCYTLYPAPSSGSTTAQTQPGGNTTPATPAIPPEPPPLTGTLVPGDTLTEKLAWLQQSADSHNTFILELTADENIAPTTLDYRGAINITIALRGDNENRTIRLSSNGTMFTVSSNVTFVLENNITLLGHNGNTGALVNVNGGELRMRSGATITGNTNVIDYNEFQGGGGVYVSSGTFEMTGGSISGNTSRQGGGVYTGANFTMSGGTISDNIALSGGGVFVGSGTFAMRGGNITSNIAGEYGGGVYVSRLLGTFTKTGGIITAYGSDPVNGNVIKDNAGNVLARRGHAVFVPQVSGDGIRKETTAGSGTNLSRPANSSGTGAWDS